MNEESRLAVRRALTASNSERSAEMRRLYQSELDRSQRVEVYLNSAEGVLLGGAYGLVRWRWFDLDVVWLSDAVAGGGAGRALMEQVENAARAMGATNVKLDTLDFQARGFYEKCGYRVYGELTNYPEAHTQYLMTKRL